MNRLEALVAEELARPAPAAAMPLAEEIRRRHGAAVAAVLFYGSCLRRQTAEGVLDFYALVDDYASAYRSRPLAWANAALAPNVFYVALHTPLGPLRSKVALVSLRDFARAASTRSVRPVIWARFCQPALAVWVRDEAARLAVARSCADALRTAVKRTLPLLPDADGLQRVRAGEFWTSLFEETYASELRAESDETIRGLWEAARPRYVRALGATLAELEREGCVTVEREADAFRITHPPGRLQRARRRRRLRRPLAKALAFVQLLKSALTFGDWLPYALWKLERHTGTKLEPSERQRRHPLLFGWPLFLRVLRSRELR